MKEKGGRRDRENRGKGILKMVIKKIVLISTDVSKSSSKTLFI